MRPPRGAQARRAGAGRPKRPPPDDEPLKRPRRPLGLGPKLPLARDPGPLFPDDEPPMPDLPP
ncbi:hypothetical protein TIFTF001_000844 [Ficus carica]|uniref:Uncharacterized protein n=1 Tax=Ficus carica TaxID=3494 RepID=A0AA87ZJ53_FICCA|nr:hypothetical protein TIFTF001_000844 [Ficus carica]